jgi:hypothetical protein
VARPASTRCDVRSPLTVRACVTFEEVLRIPGEGHRGEFLSCIVGALALVVISTSQDKPDFTGDWLLESASESAREIPQALTIRQSLIATNVFGEPINPFFKDIMVERKFESRAYTETLLIGVEGGIVPGRNPDGTSAGPYTYFSVRWEGNTLVIERGCSTEAAPPSGEWEEHQEVWSLDADGRLRVAMTTVTSTGASNTVTLVYRRRSRARCSPRHARQEIG